MEWQILLAQIINGIALGSVYALIALGYTMVYGIIKLINFAHGEVYMLGAYFGFFAITMYNLPLIPAMIVSMILAAIVGMLIEQLSTIKECSRIAALITAIGASFYYRVQLN